VIELGVFSRFRRATETPFNRVFQARNQKGFGGRVARMSNPSRPLLTGRAMQNRRAGVCSAGYTGKEGKMYGTVARMKIKDGMQDKARQLMEEQTSQPVAGQVATYAYRMDKDSNEYYIVAIFDSKESYWANAQSAEQDARYRALREILQEDPEWHDGEIVYGTELN
jgi:hypothetical protein